VRFLEHRIPPPAVGALVAALMWWMSAWPPALPLSAGVRVTLGVLLAAIGLTFDVLGLIAFRRSRTTVNPLRPDKASALVTGGVYRVTRNPMYVGMAFLLAGWAAYLASPWAVLGPLLFIAYITRFQIVPEERVLRERFPEFAAYAARVRRWL
jgi:protein-S-isoprenylcysteine O-methyltransferase Ste14